MEHTDPPAKVASNDQLGHAAEARWYAVTKSGLATLCASERDALESAAGFDVAYPHSAPHRAVLLGDVAAERERMIADGWRQTRYAAPVTDCEACLTPDACAIRGQCGHYLREGPNVM